MKVEGTKQAITFTENEMQMLFPYIKELKRKKIYQTSDIMNVIKNIPEKTESVKQWKFLMKSSIFSSNQELFNQLIDILQKK